MNSGGGGGGRPRPVTRSKPNPNIGPWRAGLGSEAKFGPRSVAEKKRRSEGQRQALATFRGGSRGDVLAQAIQRQNPGLRQDWRGRDLYGGTRRNPFLDTAFPRQTAPRATGSLRALSNPRVLGLVLGGSAKEVGAGPRDIVVARSAMSPYAAEARRLSKQYGKVVDPIGLMYDDLHPRQRAVLNGKPVAVKEVVGRVKTARDYEALQRERAAKKTEESDWVKAGRVLKAGWGAIPEPVKAQMTGGATIGLQVLNQIARPGHAIEGAIYEGRGGDKGAQTGQLPKASALSKVLFGSDENGRGIDLGAMAHGFKAGLIDNRPYSGQEIWKQRIAQENQAAIRRAKQWNKENPQHQIDLRKVGKSKAPGGVTGFLLGLTTDGVLDPLMYVGGGARSVALKGAQGVRRGLSAMGAANAEEATARASQSARAVVQRLFAKEDAKASRKVERMRAQGRKVSKEEESAIRAEHQARAERAAKNVVRREMAMRGVRSGRAAGQRSRDGVVSTMDNAVIVKAAEKKFKQVIDKPGMRVTLFGKQVPGVQAATAAVMRKRVASNAAGGAKVGFLTNLPGAKEFPTVEAVRAATAKGVDALRESVAPEAIKRADAEIARMESSRGAAYQAVGMPPAAKEQIRAQHIERAVADAAQKAEMDAATARLNEIARRAGSKGGSGIHAVADVVRASESYAQAGKKLGVTGDTLRQWLRTNGLVSVKAGSAKYVDRAGMRAFHAVGNPVRDSFAQLFPVVRPSSLSRSEFFTAQGLKASARAEAEAGKSTAQSQINPIDNLETAGMKAVRGKGGLKSAESKARYERARYRRNEHIVHAVEHYKRGGDIIAKKLGKDAYKAALREGATREQALAVGRHVAMSSAQHISDLSRYSLDSLMTAQEALKNLSPARAMTRDGQTVLVGGSRQLMNSLPAEMRASVEQLLTLPYRERMSILDAARIERIKVEEPGIQEAADFLRRVYGGDLKRARKAGVFVHERENYHPHQPVEAAQAGRRMEGDVARWTERIQTGSAPERTVQPKGAPKTVDPRFNLDSELHGAETAAQAASRMGDRNFMKQRGIEGTITEINRGDFGSKVPKMSTDVPDVARTHLENLRAATASAKYNNKVIEEFGTVLKSSGFLHRVVPYGRQVAPTDAADLKRLQAMIERWTAVEQQKQTMAGAVAAAKEAGEPLTKAAMKSAQRVLDRAIKRAVEYTESSNGWRAIHDQSVQNVFRQLAGREAKTGKAVTEKSWLTSLRAQVGVIEHSGQTRVEWYANPKSNLVPAGEEEMHAVYAVPHDGGPAWEVQDRREIERLLNEGPKMVRTVGHADPQAVVRGRRAIKVAKGEVEKATSEAKRVEERLTAKYSHPKQRAVVIRTETERATRELQKMIGHPSGVVQDVVRQLKGAQKRFEEADFRRGLVPKRRRTAVMKGDVGTDSVEKVARRALDVALGYAQRIDWPVFQTELQRLVAAGATPRQVIAEIDRHLTSLSTGQLTRAQRAAIKDEVMKRPVDELPLVSAQDARALYEAHYALGKAEARHAQTQDILDAASQKVERVEITPSYRTKFAEQHGGVKLVVMPRPVAHFMLSHVSGGKPPTKIGRGMRRVTSAWKWTNTQPNPAYHVRNSVSDFQNSTLEQSPRQFFSNAPLAARMAGAQFKATKAQRKGIGAVPAKSSKVYHFDGVGELSVEQLRLAALHNGIIDGGLTGTDIPSSMYGGVGRANNFGIGAGESVRRGLHNANESLKAYSRLRENFFRSNTAVARLRAGEDWLGAQASTNMVHFDYGNLSPTERMLRNNAVPFYTFTARNIPLWAASVFRRPGRISFFERMREEAAYSAGLNPNWSAQLSAGDAKVMPIPVKIGGKIYLLSFGPSGAPITSLNEFPYFVGSNFVNLQNNTRKVFEDWFATAGQSLNPALKFPLEGVTGFDFFYRQMVQPSYSPMTAAPAWMAAMPGGVQKLFGYRPDWRERAGKTTGASTGGINKSSAHWLGALPSYLGQANRFATPKSQKRPPLFGSKKGALFQLLTGVRATELNPDADKLVQVITQRQKVDEQLAIVRGTVDKRGKFISKENNNQTPEYKDLMAKQRKLNAEAYSLSKKLGFSKPMGTPPSKKKSGSAGGVFLND